MSYLVLQSQGEKTWKQENGFLCEVVYENTFCGNLLAFDNFQVKESLLGAESTCNLSLSPHQNIYIFCLLKFFSFIFADMKGHI